MRIMYWSSDVFSSDLRPPASPAENELLLGLRSFVTCRKTGVPVGVPGEGCADRIAGGRWPDRPSHQADCVRRRAFLPDIFHRTRPRHLAPPDLLRPEERRYGEEGVSTWRSRSG